MKKFMSLLFSALLVSIPLSSFTQGQLKIGHVNINEIMIEMPERDSAQVKLTNETKEIQSTYEEMTVEYNKLLDEYQKGLSGYAELVKKTKEAELIDKQKRLAEFEQNAAATLERRNSELIQPIYDKIIKAIERVATENGFTYILDTGKGSVVFTSKESQNINSMVLKLLKS